MATGVLVLGVGRATRLLGHLMLTEKAYDATIRLGVATTTDDAEGEVVAEADTARLDEAAVRAALSAYVGEIEQVPTAVSAIKVDGKRAYQRVRDGEAVELRARAVTIHELAVTRLDLPEVDVRVRCSSGAYSRAIARDVGRDLGVGGPLTALRRPAADGAGRAGGVPGPRTRRPTGAGRALRTAARRAARGPDRGARPVGGVPGPVRTAGRPRPAGRGVLLTGWKDADVSTQPNH